MQLTPLYYCLHSLCPRSTESNMKHVSVWRESRFGSDCITSIFAYDSNKSMLLYFRLRILYGRDPLPTKRHAGAGQVRVSGKHVRPRLLVAVPALRRLPRPRIHHALEARSSQGLTFVSPLLSPSPRQPAADLIFPLIKCWCQGDFIIYCV